MSEATLRNTEITPLAPLIGTNTPAANRETLDPTLLNQITVIRAANASYERAFTKLVGRKLKPCYLRDQIMLLAVSEWAAGKTPVMRYFQQSCANLGSISAVRAEMLFLKELNLLIIRPHPTLKHSMEVLPTQKLVDFVSVEVRALASVLPLCQQRGLH